MARLVGRPPAIRTLLLLLLNRKLLDIVKHVSRAAQEVNQLLMLVLTRILQWSLALNVDSFISTVTRVEKNLENLQIPRNADKVKRVLLLLILGFHICKVLHEQINQLSVSLQHCVVQGAVPSSLLLKINIDGHICGKFLVHELSN